jgi:hypothetical protein
MATSATNQKIHAASKAKHASRPKHWWERILIYPALAAALITAGPQWIDRVTALSQGIKSGSAKAAERQNAMWRKNLACTAMPFAWFTSPGNVKVDTTTCNSGDVFIRAVTPDNQEYFQWVPLDDVLKSSGGGMMSAHAATLSTRVSPMPATLPPRLFRLAQPQANVICQKFIDDRHILRRVSTPQGCFDEVIDTFNGQVVSRNAAPCNPQC